MSNFTPLFDYMNDIHQRTRAKGQLMNNMRRDGYVNNTKKQVVNEHLTDSVEPTRYTYPQSYANAYSIMNSRRLKMISKDDEY
jgi:hypothetical protein